MSTIQPTTIEQIHNPFQTTRKRRASESSQEISQISTNMGILSVDTEEERETQKHKHQSDDAFSLRELALSIDSVRQQQQLETERAFNEEFGNELNFLISKMQIQESNEIDLEFMPYIY